MATDVLATLTDLPGVAAAAADARGAVDELLMNRVARRRGAALAAESTLVGAWCNASFDGAEVLLDSLRSGTVEDSPMGLVAARTLAMYSELPRAAELLPAAPLQALARLHSVLATQRHDDASIGRPRTTAEHEDPLRLGDAAPPSELPARLSGLGDLITAPTAAPAIVLAGVVHAEIAVLRPFPTGSGILARAMTRAVLRAKGVDPDGWTFPEAGVRMLGRPKYIAALRAYATGEPEAVARWLVVHAGTVGAGARAASAEVENLPDPQ